MSVSVKDQVLIALYTEYQKDVPDMDSIKSSTIGVDGDSFHTSLEKLQNEGLITGVTFARGGRGNRPLVCFLSRTMLTPAGITYVERLLDVSLDDTKPQKGNKILTKLGEWGLEQLKDVVAKIMAEIMYKSGTPS